MLSSFSECAQSTCFTCINLQLCHVLRGDHVRIVRANNSGARECVCVCEVMFKAARSLLVPNAWSIGGCFVALI